MVGEKQSLKIKIYYLNRLEALHKGLSQGSAATKLWRGLILKNLCTVTCKFLTCTKL